MSGQTTSPERNARVPTGGAPPFAAVVCNPLAGGGRAPDLARRAVGRLEDDGHEVELYLTADRRGAKPAGQALRRRADEGRPALRVVVAGGDGTLRETLDGLGPWSDRIAVGIVPLGNANVVARELGIGKDLSRALELACVGEAVPMDIGTVTLDGVDDIFLAMVGVGWDARTVERVDRIRHGRLGRIAYRTWADGLYGAAALAAALERDEARFLVRVDGGPLPTPFVSGWICNLRTYGKGMAVAPTAHRSSGRLHAQLRHRAGAVALGRQLVAALGARETAPSVATYVEGVRFELSSDRPLAIQIDGDVRGRARALEVGIRPGAARIVARR